MPSVCRAIFDRRTAGLVPHVQPACQIGQPRVNPCRDTAPAVFASPIFRNLLARGDDHGNVDCITSPLRPLQACRIVKGDTALSTVKPPMSGSGPVYHQRTLEPTFRVDQVVQRRRAPPHIPDSSRCQPSLLVTKGCQKVLERIGNRIDRLCGRTITVVIPEHHSVLGSV